MDVTQVWRGFLIGGMVYLATQYGCSAVRCCMRFVAKIIFGTTRIKDMQIHLASTEEECALLVGELQRYGFMPNFLCSVLVFGYFFLF